MTAEIAILNTYGVAMAADSAVTLSIGNNDKKIYNSANKLFTLSKYHPVGIMIYSNAQFMDIEWEILIKEYRHRLGKKSFNSLYDYAEDFFTFLINCEYITDEQKDKSLFLLLLNSMNKIKTSFINDLRFYMVGKETIDDLEAAEVFRTTLERITSIQDKMKVNDLYVINPDYIKQKQAIYDSAISRCFENLVIPEFLKEELFNTVVNDIQKSNNFPGFTGIVISGFGEKELFPSLYTCNVYAVVDSCLIRTNQDKNTISHKNKAVIMPFAQSEMVRSFMEGIDPTFNNVIDREMNILCNELKKITKEESIQKIDEIQKAFKTSLSDFQRKTYVVPVINIVESLQKSDLAEMAESLVNLTSFKRHVSTEAETVGGPTDVAIITKGDGFIWIKRKHYFDPNLNKHFFENYFREECKDE